MWKRAKTLRVITEFVVEQGRIMNFVLRLFSVEKDRDINVLSLPS